MVDLSTKSDLLKLFCFYFSEKSSWDFTGKCSHVEGDHGKFVSPIDLWACSACQGF